MTQEIEKTQQQLSSELEEAQRKVREARARLAEIENLKLKQAELQILERRAAEEKKIQEARERHLKRESEIREQREKERLAHEMAEKKRREEELELQRIVAAQEAVIADRKVQEEKIKKLSEEQFLLEQSARLAEADLYRQKSPEIVSNEIADVGPRNDRLAFAEESRDASKDTQGRNRLFARSNAGATPDYNVDPLLPAAQPQTSAEYVLPAEYKVINGRLSEPVFRKLFGPEHPFSFFISLQDGTLCAHGYRFRVDGLLSRNFSSGCQCTIEQHNGNYVLSPLTVRSGSRERVEITPIEPDALFKPEPLNAAELAEAVAVDQDEDLISEVTRG